MVQQNPNPGQDPAQPAPGQIPNPAHDPEPAQPTDPTIPPLRDPNTPDPRKAPDDPGREQTPRTE